VRQQVLQAQANDEQKRIADTYLLREGGSERLSSIRADLYEAMESGAGIYRDEASLLKACETIAELRERSAHIKLDDHSNCFNTELTAALELEFLLDVAQALAHSALARTESRGSHQRTDFPERNDERFLKHSLAYFRKDGTPRIEYLDVVITRWPPAERMYGTTPAEAVAEKQE